MAVFLAVFCLFWTYDLYIEPRISDMAAWIDLIFYSMITYIPGVMPVFSDFEKIENWRFYGSFSYNFRPGFHIVQSFSEIVLRDGRMDSNETLQQPAL